MSRAYSDAKPIRSPRLAEDTAPACREEEDLAPTLEMEPSRIWLHLPLTPVGCFGLEQNHEQDDQEY